jgi:hypothetical protein
MRQPACWLSQKCNAACHGMPITAPVLSLPPNFQPLIKRSNAMRIAKSLGTLTLAAWLILQGLMHFIHLSFSGIGMVTGGLAVTAGVLLILGL